MVCAFNVSVYGAYSSALLVRIDRLLELQGQPTKSNRDSGTLHSDRIDSVTDCSNLPQRHRTDLKGLFLGC